MRYAVLTTAELRLLDVLLERGVFPDPPASIIRQDIAATGRVDPKRRGFLHLRARIPGILAISRPVGGLLAHGSISELLSTEYGVTLSRAVERIEAVLAGPDEAEALGIRVGAPLMSVRRVTYTDDGVPMEYAHDLFRGDRARTGAWTRSPQPCRCSVPRRPAPYRVTSRRAGRSRASW